jgi:hypothetical protein
MKTQSVEQDYFDESYYKSVAEAARAKAQAEEHISRTIRDHRTRVLREKFGLSD